MLPSAGFHAVIDRIRYTLVSELAAKQVSDSIMGAASLIHRPTLMDAASVAQLGTHHRPDCYFEYALLFVFPATYYLFYLFIYFYFCSVLTPR